MKPDNGRTLVQKRHCMAGKGAGALNFRCLRGRHQGVIDKSSLVPAKKDRLYDKINAFSRRDMDDDIPF
jgi:hypothetical protein